jgi:hypothetical protein
MIRIDLSGAPVRGMNRRKFLAGAGAGLFVLGTTRNVAWPQNTKQSVLSGTGRLSAWFGHASSARPQTWRAQLVMTRAMCSSWRACAFGSDRTNG